jgi:acyl carrier protein
MKRLITMNPNLENRIDTDAFDEPIQRFGVDSLLAIELRSWFAKEFAADIPIFEILGEGTLKSIAVLTTQRSTLSRGNT